MSTWQPHQTTEQLDSEFDTGRFVRTLNGHSNELTSIQFSDDGSQLVTSSMDATVRVWNVVTGEEVIQFNGHTGQYGCALLR